MCAGQLISTFSCRCLINRNLKQEFLINWETLMKYRGFFRSNNWIWTEQLSTSDSKYFLVQKKKMKEQVCVSTKRELIGDTRFRFIIINVNKNFAFLLSNFDFCTLFQLFCFSNSFFVIKKKHFVTPSVVDFCLVFKLSICS